ncbi:MAG: SIR2 family protein [Syntrophaceae bacterium]|nr:SIR2 family protein [Syntrophaceae bacterium]
MSNVIHQHDAQKTLAALRDHLARHDKPIAFLFGAGASCSVKVENGGEVEPIIPAVAGLTDKCKVEAANIDPKFGTAWELIEKHCCENNLASNVENILSQLRMMIAAIGHGDTLSGLNRDEINKLEESVRKTIAKVVSPDLSSLPINYPHRKFARWLSKTSRQNPIEIFTLNYDVLLEHALEAERIPVFDGFVGSYRPFFHPDSLRRLDAAPGANWTRLWKMHGSVTWSRVNFDGRARVIRGEPNSEGEMIYPSFQKYDESRQQPYSALVDRLSRFLEQDDALLIVVGFSFGDEHINNHIFEALENKPRTHVYALQFDEIECESVLVKRAMQRRNLIALGPQKGIIGGRISEWAPVESPLFMADVFELISKEQSDDGGGGKQEPKTGRMKIGDFASFSSFLQSMVGD